ncbi:MAG: radical SAM protein, partial [Deltaproteobacteria bacterium]
MDSSQRSRRFAIFSGLIGLAFLVLVSGFFNLQVLKRDYYLEISLHNFVRPVTRNPVRGLIFDRNGRLLVDNRPSFSAAVVPAHAKESTLFRLEEILHLSDQEVRKKLRRAPRFSPTIIRRDLDDSTRTLLEENQYFLPGFELNLDFKRYYPPEVNSPHIFGYIGEVSEAEQKRHPQYKAGDLIGKTEMVQVDDIMSVTETAGHLIDGFGTRSRAYVQVQNGCDHRCTFCIIPYGRGNSRSVPAGVVVEQIRRLVDAGYLEVVLTGVDLTSWGADLPGTPRLGDLVRRILKLVPDLPRLRISSIDSIEADPALIEAIATEPRLMPHLHLSLQAGDNLILKRMKRRHSRDDAIRFCHEMRAARPDLVYGADIIAGFPTETDEMFENTLAMIRDCGLTWLHVFPYSPRKGTPAA